MQVLKIMKNGQGYRYRRRCSQVFHRIGVGLQINQKKTPSQEFSLEFYKSFENEDLKC